jgi:hypothetical protein
LCGAFVLLLGGEVIGVIPDLIPRFRQLFVQRIGASRIDHRTCPAAIERPADVGPWRVQRPGPSRGATNVVAIGVSVRIDDFLFERRRSKWNA